MITQQDTTNIFKNVAGGGSIPIKFEIEIDTASAIKGGAAFFAALFSALLLHSLLAKALK